MTAVTLSPHQLANLQQQHQGLPGANKQSRARTVTTQVNCAASFHNSEHANERPDPMEVPRRTENRQYKTSDRSVQGALSEPNSDINLRPRGDSGERSDVKQSSGALESKPSSSASGSWSQQGPKEPLSQHEKSQPKTASDCQTYDLPIVHLREATPGNSEAEAVKVTGSGIKGIRKELPRAKSDLGPRGASPTDADATTEEENWELRHGWEDQYNSNEYLSLLTSVSRHMHQELAFGAKRDTNIMRASTELFVS